jgi:hypothetical protein
VWNTLGRDGCVEHATEGDTINITGMYTEADNAPSELIHNDEHPVALQINGLTSKQVNTPKAVLGLSEQAQP